MRYLIIWTGTPAPLISLVYSVSGTLYLVERSTVPAKLTMTSTGSEDAPWLTSYPLTFSGTKPNANLKFTLEHIDGGGSTVLFFFLH